MVDHRWPNIDPGRKAVWTSAEPESSDVINEKILSAFSNVKSFPLKRIIIQLWQPVKTTAGKRLLSCDGNPYAVSLVNLGLCRYRSCCSKYYYGIDDGRDLEYDSMTINGAPPAAAFLTGFPEVVMDIRVHRGTPLVDLALECELTCFVMLPVFDGTSCIGVVEVSARCRAHLVAILNNLKHELKKMDFTICTPDAGPRKAVTGDLKLALSEIGKALQAEAFQSHAITLGQVWMPYVRRTQMLLGKLDIISPGNSDGNHLSSFYHDLDVLPFRMGEGLVGRTLKTQRPHLCRNIYKLSDNSGVLGLLFANTKCTCFVTCLRSSHTREHDYVFEFFWPESRNHLVMMEGLLLTLKEYLPSFKHASGVRLGDELLVVDVENSSSVVMIFPGNKLSQPRASLGMKRKSINDDEEEDDDLVIFAFYKVDHRLFFLPSSPTFKSFMEKIYEEFGLNRVGAYKIEYQVVPGEWYSLTNGRCLKSCISSYQTSTTIDHIKLCVRALEK